LWTLRQPGLRLRLRLLQRLLLHQLARPGPLLLQPEQLSERLLLQRQQMSWTSWRQS
jgi:hypothetical protein